jgi:Fe-S-cluster-containing hydrogenase component 2
MIVNQEKCLGCKLCIPYCIAGAIYMQDKKAVIDRDLCVECSVCKQVAVCKYEAFEEDQLEWPRAIRRTYSNVMSKHPQTGMTGRGTPEMKTNEVTGKYRRGEVGLGVELGRPDVFTRFRDVEIVAKVLAKAGVTFDPEAPTTLIMTDSKRGTLPPEILNERVICVILECKAQTEKLPAILEALYKVSKQIDTVFSLDMITVAEEDGSLRNIKIARRLGYEVRPNAKTTVGLGRPLFKAEENLQ